MSAYNFDVLIIGCGVAGLTAALKLGESGARVGVITRETDPNISNTFWAQGGISFPSQNDGLKSDIMRASSNTSYEDAADIMVKKSSKILKEILVDKVKTNFEKNKNGEFLFTKEAAHSVSRILYRGDYTGREIQVSLLNYLKDKSRFPNITILAGHTAIDLLTPIHHGIKITQRYEEARVLGAYVLNQATGLVDKALAKVTVLATGGVASLYLHHSNSEGARGDGHAMARRAGAVITDMEFIQFHPTTFFDKSSHRRFLVSEAIRGEGGILRNCNGVAFMEKYHHDKELAPRDVVSRAIDQEMTKTKHDCVYLDISHKEEVWIKERFPTIYKHCLDKQVDITKIPIPVVPSAHYTCGGIKTDLKGRTNLQNLYAVGEVACTGLHGANRLASTSLAEGLTWGYLAAENIKNIIDSIVLYEETLIQNWHEGGTPADPALIHQDWLTLKQTMWNYVGLTRTPNRLKRAQAMFGELYDEIQKFYKDAIINDELIGLRNAVEVGHLVLNASIRNKESVGCFYRTNS